MDLSLMKEVTPNPIAVFCLTYRLWGNHDSRAQGHQIENVLGGRGMLISLALVFALGAADAPGPFINTWLVAGTFDNAPGNAGFEFDWIDETTVQPRDGSVSAGRTWRYFDDRLFSRNYDDYQDLFSYFRVKRNESIRAKIAYACVYVHSVDAQTVQLRTGADNEFKAWINGTLVASSTEGLPERDMSIAPAELKAGWNRLLFKIGNQEEGRLGFYARLCDERGNRIPGLTYALSPGDGKLSIATKGMSDIATGDLPVAWREWSYIGARVTGTNTWPPMDTQFLRKPGIAMQASDFVLGAAGGTPPYRWSLVNSALPKGMELREDGSIVGTPAKDAELRDYLFRVRVVDGANATAEKDLSLSLRERPNKWVEEARLTALIHHPESMPPDSFDKFAQLMSRQNYGLGMVISYNNGEYRYRWPSRFEPDNPEGILIGRYKAALEKAGVKFGMYIGNIDGPNHNGPNGAILLVEDAIRSYQPSAFWFDWAGWDATSPDALYSMIKSYNPETVVILNGIPTMSNGDWDIIDLEGWGCWGDRLWDLWPFEFPWPKKSAVETWRLIADPAFEYSKGVEPDWQSYMQLQIALIAEGHIANIDHSPTLVTGVDSDGKLPDLNASPLMAVHRKMAEWTNPAGLPPLHESYTHVNPGPLRSEPWGYSTINVARDTIYLHLLKTPMGKTGRPEGNVLTVGPVAQRVATVACMNSGTAMNFDQKDQELTVDLYGIEADPVDTIIKVVLAGPHPDVEAPALSEAQAVPPGNMAWRKPGQLLGVAGDHTLPASGFHFAHYANDGIPSTYACGGNEWAWMYHLDLEAERQVGRIVIHFEGLAPDKPGYPTEYKVHVSSDGKTWTTVAHVTECKGGTHEHTFDALPTRYVRVEAVTPNGPDQEGSQMCISELEVYER